MSEERARSLMEQILTEDELSRIHFEITGTGTCVSVDVHRLTVAEAKRLIKNLIALIRGDFILEVIHGYLNGTAIKDMIHEETLSKKVVDKKCPFYNLGITYLKIKDEYLFSAA